ncbi:hypothetical protein [Pectinatus frisingensis]|uniref:hypothetical protein n=1 Tax=Pectinatus frisingensis TaxID=865 RepID=UPI0018C8291F|nr:hypothetical protein [Pectinatus frisingensis]
MTLWALLLRINNKPAVDFTAGLFVYLLQETFEGCIAEFHAQWCQTQMFLIFYIKYNLL